MFHGMNVLYFLLSLPFDFSNYVGLGVGIAIDGEIPLKVALMKKMMTLPEFEKSPPSDVDYSGFVKKVSDVIATIVNVLDPSVAIIGGDVNLFPDSLLNDLMDSIYLLQLLQTPTAMFEMAGLMVHSKPRSD